MNTETLHVAEEVEEDDNKISKIPIARMSSPPSSPNPASSSLKRKKLHSPPPKLPKPHIASMTSTKTITTQNGRKQRVCMKEDCKCHHKHPLKALAKAKENASPSTPSFPSTPAATSVSVSASIPISTPKPTPKSKGKPRICTKDKKTCKCHKRHIPKPRDPPQELMYDKVEGEVQSPLNTPQRSMIIGMRFLAEQRGEMWDWKGIEEIFGIGKKEQEKVWAEGTCWSREDVYGGSNGDVGGSEMIVEGAEARERSVG